MLDQVDLICGDMSPNVARVFARVPLPDAESDWQLRGTVRGPFSRFADTLPHTYPMQHLGPGTTLLAATTVTDPCFWSPDNPMLYTVLVQLVRGVEVVEETEFVTGLRHLGVDGRDFRLESRRWVLRAADRGLAETHDWDAWRDASLGQLAACDLENCREASENGVMLAVEVDAASKELNQNLRQLSRLPAVAFAVLNGGPEDGESLAKAGPNLILAQRFASGSVPRPASWCQVAFCEVGSVDSFHHDTSQLSLPIVAMRSLGHPAPLAQLRSACERLQRDLALNGDYAGYVV